MSSPDFCLFVGLLPGLSDFSLFLLFLASDVSSFFVGFFAAVLSLATGLVCFFLAFSTLAASFCLRFSSAFLAWFACRAWQSVLQRFRMSDKKLQNDGLLNADIRPFSSQASPCDHLLERNVLRFFLCAFHLSCCCPDLYFSFPPPFLSWQALSSVCTLLALVPKYLSNIRLCQLKSDKFQNAGHCNGSRRRDEKIDCNTHIPRVPLNAISVPASSQQNLPILFST